ncbi:GNAT family N-acetyltransferase [Methanofollis formosanus]|uniref:GNAT family N-acetyltransferase n=1 Tax=Methanofollis formosanus TaxID=299308 RepID=UPI001C7DDB44|nr:GNAT family N-acetyltransferase [Methanofollis formosanus]
MLSGITVRTVGAWDAEEIVGLYRAGEWWKEEWTADGIPALIEGSFCFVVAVDDTRAVGMGRAISDGCSDAYLQDIIVLPEYRGHGIGDAIVEALVEFCTARDLAWIGLIAQPGTVAFYRRHGFARMTGHVPMLLKEENDLS